MRPTTSKTVRCLTLALSCFCLDPGAPRAAAAAGHHRAPAPATADLALSPFRARRRRPACAAQ